MRSAEDGATKAGRRTPWLAAGAFLIGVVLTAIGIGVGLSHLAKSGVGVVSVIGLMALVLGITGVFVAGVAILRATPRWCRLLVGPVLLLVAVMMVYVLAVPLRAAVPARAPASSAAPGGVTAQAVTVPTDDGQELAGWYVPSSTGAAVVLLPGSGSSSAALGAHLEVLTDGGFGVLALDPRGHGRSTGRGMDWGWNGDQDLPAAVTYLTARDDVDPQRIAVLGLSMGGEQAIGAAGVDPRIRAVVAEGVTGRSAADLCWLSDAYGWRGSFTRWVREGQTALADALSPAGPPPPLPGAAAAASPRPMLLIVAGDRPDELHAATAIQAAAPDSVEIWVVPGAGHTAGLRTDPAGWTERVLGFLADATD